MGPDELGKRVVFGNIGIADVLLWVLQAVTTFAVSTFIFDTVHWLLHRWTKSRFAMLRTFASWHHVHHRFLDGKMQVHMDLAAINFWAHLVPEFLTSVAGTAVFYLFFHWIPVTLVVLIHVWNFGNNIITEGMDGNHMSMDRVSARQNIVKVNAAYHAMHHITPENFYSSYLNLFDLLFGRSCTIRHRRFLITGAGGAFGSAMKRRIEGLGGIVEVAKHGTDFAPGDIARMRDKFERADVLILSHGAKGADAWEANYTTFTELADQFVAMGKERLVPPKSGPSAPKPSSTATWASRSSSITLRASGPSRAGHSAIIGPRTYSTGTLCRRRSPRPWVPGRCRRTPRRGSPCSSSGVAFPTCR